jgi:CelD/BcsL family acetyltransferase involved in cellulose biosynthesis
MSWIILPASAFEGYKQQWRELNAASAASPLLEPDFVTPLLAEFANGQELLVCYVRERVTLLMGIVVPRRRGVWETFQPSQAPLGIWLQRPGVDAAPLLDSLMRQLPGTPLIFGLTQCDPWHGPRPADSATQNSIDYIDTAHITVEGSFDDYWAARGKNLRANMKKQRAKLHKEGIVARLQISRAPEEMAEAVRDFGRLESAGWKAGLGTALHGDNDQGRFYRAMLEAFCRRGCASVYRYWFNDQLVAMDLCVEGNGMIVVLKTSYDESVPSGLSPSLLMREECCRLFFEQGRFGRVEFYGKVLEWHTRWTEEIRTLYHLNHYRWPGLVRLHRFSRRSPSLLGQLRARLAPRAAPAGPVSSPLE